MAGAAAAICPGVGMAPVRCGAALGWLLAVASLLPEARCKASDVGAGSSAAGLPFFRGMR